MSSENLKSQNTADGKNGIHSRGVFRLLRHGAALCGPLSGLGDHVCRPGSR